VLSAPAHELEAVTRAAAQHARRRHDPSAYAATMASLLRAAAANPRALPRDVLAAEAAPDEQPEAAHGA
jgi:hypothetical protein